MIIKVQTEISREIFLDFPGQLERLYPEYACNEDRNDTASLIAGTHVLSDTMEFQAYLLLKDETLSLDNCLARIALILLKDSDDAYFGCFSARPELSDIKDLTAYVEEKAGALGRKRLIGPVNGSFWLGYRFKIDHFDAKPYYGEPRNPANYPELFLTSSYKILEVYRSNIYPKGAVVTPQMRKRLSRFLEEGYEIRRPKRIETKALLGDVYRLIMNLFADFPAFQAIREDQFSRLFQGLPLIADYKLIRIGRYEGKTVGFLIALPDYGTKLDASRSMKDKIMAIFSKRLFKRVVLLYLGVEKEHLGLASALITDFSVEIDRRKSSLVGALIAGDKVSGSYARQEISETRRYALFTKDIQ